MRQVTITELRAIDYNELLTAPEPFEIVVKPGGGGPMVIACVIPGLIYHSDKQHYGNPVSSMPDSVQEKRRKANTPSPEN